MKSKTLLVVYATVHGQAEAIAHRIAEAAANGEVQASVRDARDTSAADLAACDSVVIVASVHFGRHQRSIAKLIRRNRDRLSALHSAFVSVSGSAVDPLTQPDAIACADEFLRSTGWAPSQRQIFGGAVQFTKYNPFMRFVLKRVFASKGVVMDARRDYDYTDWNAVSRFAKAFVSDEDVKVA